ncbi:MAG: hypothetical protein JJV99_11765 [Colwellia sp.]|nr:hypothetical protein [Colwellia sp.]
MSDYFIKSTNEKVQVSRIINNELEAIKINGELIIALPDFWFLFKEKIEYEIGEQLAFIILTNDETFNVDANITIAEKFITPKHELHTLIVENLTGNSSFTSFPALDINVNEMNDAKIFNSALNEPELEMKGDSLQSFYKKKTKAMQKEYKKDIEGR